MKRRADQQLVESGLVETRSRARDLIKRGEVYINGRQVKKPSEQIEEATITIEGENNYVSRGYLKLKGFCQEMGLSFQGQTVGDFGASTGGFTQYALEMGAEKVYCVDVGTDQLHASLKANEKVVDLQQVNIKHGVELETKIDMAVIDLSFISLKLVIDNIANTLNPGASLLALVKPQFEVGRDNLDKSGIVKSSEYSLSALKSVLKKFNEHGISIQKARKCLVPGKCGNQEYFFYGMYDDSDGITETELEIL